MYDRPGKGWTGKYKKCHTKNPLNRGHQMAFLRFIFKIGNDIVTTISDNW